MIQPELLVRMFNFSVQLILKQADGMTHTQSLLTPSFGCNSFNWVLGHIISARTFPLKYVGENPIWTEEERTRYKHSTSNIMTDGEGVYRLEILLEALIESQKRLTRGLVRTTMDDLAMPSGYGDNTVAESLVYFQFHESHHAGQLIYLAQYAGFPGVWVY